MTFEKIAKVVVPYLVCFLAGVLLSWKGCGSSGNPETVTIEKPVYKTEYVDRWREKPVRYVDRQIIIKTDTIYREKVVNRSDTIFYVDTVRIVEAWLTEMNRYDTTVTFGDAYFTLRWQNYQNLTENLTIDYTPKKVPLKWALGVHANAGLISDFSTRYTPLFGLGLQTTIKNNYIAADYGFNGQHYVGVRYGRNIIQR
jgi:hypothetical protein